MAVRGLALAVAAVSLTGCGVLYTSPRVSSFATGPELNVSIVPLTPSTVVRANLAPYEPRQLPASATRPISAAIGPATSVPQPVLPPVATSQPAPARPPQTTLPPALEQQPYRIGVGDVLLISSTAPVTQEELPSLVASQGRRQGFVVQDDGAISIPDVDRILVGNLTLEEAEANIFEALVDAQIDPTFSLEIREFNARRVTVGGAVRQPAIVPITLQALTLTTALELAGGFALTDPDFGVVRLFRDGATYTIAVRDILSDNLPNVLLQDGDRIIVDSVFEQDQAQRRFDEQLRLAQVQASATQSRLAAESEARARAQLELQRQEAELRSLQLRDQLDALPRDFVYLAGEVRQTARFPLPYGQRAVLADALFSSGGPQVRFSDYGNIYIIRTDGPGEFGGIVAYHLNARNAATLALASRMELRPADIVFVAEQPITTFNRIISQLVPNIIVQTTNALDG